MICNATFGWECEAISHVLKSSLPLLHHFPKHFKLCETFILKLCLAFAELIWTSFFNKYTYFKNVMMLAWNTGNLFKWRLMSLGKCLGVCMCYLCLYLWLSVFLHECMCVRQITQTTFDSSCCICIPMCLECMKYGAGGSEGCANMPSQRNSLQAGRTWPASTVINNSYYKGLITYSSNTHWSRGHCCYLFHTHPCTNQGMRVSSPLLSWL